MYQKNRLPKLLKNFLKVAETTIKKPALIEALALNLADNADAKLETMTEILKGAGDNMGWLGYNRFMESNVRRTSDGQEK